MLPNSRVTDKQGTPIMSENKTGRIKPKKKKIVSTYSFNPERMSRMTLKDSSGLTSRSSWKPRDSMLRDSISRASISSVMAFHIISHTVGLAPDYRG